MLDKRMERARKARRLQEALGKGYLVNFDACESGMTDVTYTFNNGTVMQIKRFHNDLLDSDINVYDYQMTQDQRAFYYNMGLI